jgi:uridine kinase
MRIDDVVEAIATQHESRPDRRATLVAISGIDGSGKGYIAAKLVARLVQKHLRVANINIDGWLNLPDRRFSRSDPAEYFYQHAIRFDELFARLVFPLQDLRSICVEADYAEETATNYRKHTYNFENIDVIVLEGIFLLKRQLQPYYDLSFWVECSFETALERAIARSQEGLPPEETVKAYQTIYFPAQRIHCDRDRPRTVVTACINNDLRLREDAVFN